MGCVDMLVRLSKLDHVESSPSGGNILLPPTMSEIEEVQGGEPALGLFFRIFFIG